MDTAKAFIAPRLRALAIMTLVAAQIALMIGQIATFSVGLARLDADVVSANEAFGVAYWLGNIEALAYWAAFVVFLTWVYRATKNLPALGSLNHRYSPGGAVWAYLIPITNLVRGHQAMADIWRESQPAAVDGRGVCLPRNATLVHWWWAMLVIVRLLQVNRYGTLPHNVLRDVVVGRMVHVVLSIVAGVLFMLVVHGAERRQEAQWQDLVLRQNVPQPTADALR